MRKGAHVQIEEGDVKRLFLVTLGSAMFLAGCGGTAAPAESTASVADSPVATSDPEVRRAPAPPVRGRAPEPAAANRRPAAATATPARPAPEARPLPEYRELVIPSGTILPLRLTSSVASDTSQVEDAVQAVLREDVSIEEGAVLPAGSELVGRVIDAERSGRVRGRARVAFRFTMLKHDGDEYDVRTEAIERVAAATKSEDATKVGIGAGAGAALGAILGGGSGAAKGAAIGAAAGTGAVLATRGEEVRLDAGEPVETHLTAPLSFRVPVR